LYSHIKIPPNDVLIFISITKSLTRHYCRDWAKKYLNKYIR